MTFVACISGTGNLVETGSGVLSLQGNNTFSGVTTVSGGTLQLGNPSGLGNSALVANATVDLYGNSPTIVSLAGSGTITDSIPYGMPTLSVSGASTTQFSGTINDGAGTTTLVQDGPGTLILSGTNTYAAGRSLRAASWK